MFSIIDAGAGSVERRRMGAKRTCDQCKLRKVRCDMSQPCRQCSDKAFNCTYERVRKKRGPSGKRIESIWRQQNPSLISEDGEPMGDLVSASMAPKLDGDMDYDLQRVLSSGSSHSALGGTSETPSGASYWEDNASQSSSNRIDPELMSPVQDFATPTSAPAANALAKDLSQDTASLLLEHHEFLLPSLPMDSPSHDSEMFGAMLSQIPTNLSVNAERWPQAVNEETLLPWIDVYFKRLHPTMPILSRTNMYHDMILRQHYRDHQYGAMLLSLCAFAMTQPVQIHEVAEAPSRSVQARMLMEECMKLRVAVDFGENPTLEMVLASFFLFACLFGNGQHKAAWHRLREAVDLAQSLGIHLVQSYEPLDSITREKWLRTYLVLSVTEKAYALQQRRPIGFRGQAGFNARFVQTLSLSEVTDATGNLSQLQSHEPSDTLAITGLLLLAETFSAFDVSIVECWNGHCKLSDGVCELFDRRRALQIFQTQRRAREICVSGDVLKTPGSQDIKLSELAVSQQADISVTHFWLLNRLWLLCLSHGLLRSTSDYPELRHDFACAVASATWATCKMLPFGAMEVHGVGFAEKIYDIALGVITALRLDASLNLHTAPSGPVTHQLLVDTFTLEDEVADAQTLLQSFSALLNSFRGGDHSYGSQLEAAMVTIDGR